MKRLGFNAIVIVVIILIARFQPALAREGQTPKSVDQNRENFAGWGGSTFYCYDTGKEPDEVLTKICENSYINAEFLAASAKINLKKAESLRQVGWESNVEDRLILMVELIATRPPKAVAVRLKAYTHFSGPVEKLAYEDLKDPNELPQFVTAKRYGDLIFWERAAIGASSGTGEDLVSPMSDSIDTLLKQFFAAYLNAQR